MSLQQIFDDYIQQAAENETNPLLERGKDGVVRIYRLVNVKDSETGDTLLHMALKGLDTYKKDRVKHKDCIEILRILRLDYEHYANVFITNLAGETAYDLLKRIPARTKTEIDLFNFYPNKFLGGSGGLFAGPGEPILINSDEDKRWSQFNDVAKGNTSVDTRSLPVYIQSNGKKISATQMAIINGNSDANNNFKNKKSGLIYRALKNYKESSSAKPLEALVEPGSEISSIIPNAIYGMISFGLDHDVISFQLITAATAAIKNYAQQKQKPAEIKLEEKSASSTPNDNSAAPVVTTTETNPTADTNIQAESVASAPETKPTADTRGIENIQAELVAKAQMEAALYKLAEHTELPILDSFLNHYPKTNADDVLKQEKRDLICDALRAYHNDNDIKHLQKLIEENSDSRKIIRKPTGPFNVLNDGDTDGFNLITAAIKAVENNAENKQEALEKLAAYADMPVSKNYFDLKA